VAGLERDGRVVGYAYGSKHRDRAAYAWSVDVSVYVDAAHHRAGIGRALYSSLLALLRLQGFYAAHAGITLPNVASVGLHESFGFRLVGIYAKVGYKRSAWHDVGWWQLPLRERKGKPAPPPRDRSSRCAAIRHGRSRLQPGSGARLARGREGHLNPCPLSFDGGSNSRGESSLSSAATGFSAFLKRLRHRRTGFPVRK